ncbi:hypothetical protein EJ05DRAFT_509767 [Pseudovirgaria hyperparasitica]|uniref:Homeobox domain-containing protein n=1 Tax=Pseudovirgaria hyperparasitica TaxID=470096 RepID=A0A6A6W8K0_9PEZI|nr:uncharacterized protein EJ05DRAFT_509767 [Pseudovirgaria hyperparasitica]KAF2758875.1 hypothetical protein EJ05DRAFT_509767 [Pseudovirgaria hyperparasitica]
MAHERESRTALPGISTVKTSSPVSRHSHLYAPPSPSYTASDGQETMASPHDRNRSPSSPSTDLKDRKYSNDSAVDFDDYHYSTPESTLRLPSIQNLLREVAPAAPPTPASSAPSAVPSPIDPLRSQHSRYDAEEPMFDRRRRMDDRSAGYARLENPHQDPRRSSGVSDYDKRHTTVYNSPQTVAPQSPPVGPQSMAPTQALSFPPGQLPMRPTHQPIPTLPPLPNQHPLPPFGARVETHGHTPRWYAEAPVISSREYGYSRDPTTGQYDAQSPWASGPEASDRYLAYGHPRPYDGHYGSGQITFQPVGPHGDGQIPRKRRGNLPKEATAILKAWYNEHIDSPYPTEDDKLMLCNQAHLSINQVSNWFINARRRAPGREGRGSQSSKGSPPAVAGRPA